VRSDRPYLGHILDSIEAIERYVAAGREHFLAERIVQDAVIRNFEVIGEAAGRLSPATRDAASLPWNRIVALRNRLIHGYWSVDALLLWDIIEHELPRLKPEVSVLLARPEP
jgi:uncharacterized protein with HEPN domain